MNWPVIILLLQQVIPNLQTLDIPEGVTLIAESLWDHSRL